MTIRDALRRRDPFLEDRGGLHVGELDALRRPAVVDVRGGDLVPVILVDGVASTLSMSTVVEYGLDPDPFDTWDSNAVHVTLAGRRIGRLAADAAARFAPMLHEHLWQGSEVRTIGMLCADGRMFLALLPPSGELAA